MWCFFLTMLDMGRIIMFRAEALSPVRAGGRVAQLDRAVASQARCRRFESCPAHIFPIKKIDNYD